MKLLPFLLLTVAAAAMSPAVHAQNVNSLADSLAMRSLSLFDLPAFEWEGEPEPLRPRLGVYLNQIPADSMGKIPGLTGSSPAFRIWHIMPHWSADEGGMLIGDIITALNGRSIGDSAYQGEEFLNVTVRDMKPGETARFTVVRNGRARELPVKLLTAERVVMPVQEIGRLGPVRRDTWLQGALAANNLVEWARTIQKQMRIICDQDFSTVRFAGRPNPWRLAAVTYLHHNPTRVGAVARAVDDNIWAPMTRRSGLRGVIAQASQELTLPIWEMSTGRRGVWATEPSNMDEFRRDLDSNMIGAKKGLDMAYAPAGSELDSVTVGLVRLLDMDRNWEEQLDSTKDPIRRRELRNAYERRLGDMFATCDKVMLQEVAHAAWMLAGYLDSSWIARFAHTAQAARGQVTQMVQGVEGEVLMEWTSPAGRCVVGGSGPNRYTGDFAFIFDVGGRDIYDLPAARPGSLRLLCDAAGDDIYRSDAYGQGAGVGCVDLLADLSGNDIYVGSRYSQGAAVLGVGILADFAGNDQYTSRWCSQGAALHGIGILYDAAGADTYNAEVYSQGFGYIRGFGAIMERSGNDQYRAGWKYPDSRYPNRAHLAMSQGFGFGMRPWSTGIGTDGGIGLLSDMQGDDLYASDYFSQGGSYWYALGILHDAKGADRYTAGQYSQGSGIHLSFGALLDDAGDDMYDAYAGLEQGNAHDWSSGCLEDAGGNDTYRGSTSSQGSALTVSFAWLLDLGGDDQYYARLSDTTHSQGGGNANRVRRGGSLGMLLDVGAGNDYYVEPRVLPGTPIVKGNGILFDDGPPPVKNQ